MKKSTHKKKRDDSIHDQFQFILLLLDECEKAIHGCSENVKTSKQRIAILNKLIKRTESKDLHELLHKEIAYYTDMGSYFEAMAEISAERKDDITHYLDTLEKEECDG